MTVKIIYFAVSPSPWQKSVIINMEPPFQDPSFTFCNWDYGNL